MKKHIINYILSGIAIAVIVVSFSACGGGGGGGEEDVTLKQLTAGTWQMSSVTVDGVNQNALFTGLTLTFTATGYTAVNGDPVWPASGTWSFADADKKTIVRNDGVTVNLESISDNSLT